MSLIRNIQLFKAANRCVFASRGISSSQCLKTLSSDKVLRPSEQQKKMLVKAKIYASEKDIPEFVSSTQLEKSQDLWRVRANMKMAAFFLTVFLGVIIYGRVNRSQKILERDHLVQAAMEEERNRK